MISPEVRKYLDGVVGVVEATSFEQHTLWEHYSNESARAGFGRKAPTVLYDWVSTGMGFFACTGHFGGEPVYISLMTATVAGHKLLFYYASGTTANHDVIEAWLTENVAEYHNSTDAQNFTNVFASLRTREAA